MTVSQNGWLVSPPNRSPMRISGVLFGDVRDGDVFTVLSHVAARYDIEVEPLVSGQCGCYNPRKIPGTNVWSNHASATAIDCNWQRHPLGARNTYTTHQVHVIRDILAECDGVIRWGGDFSNVDEMHFEINRGPAAVHALAIKLTTKGLDMTPAQSKQLAKDIVDEFLGRDLGKAGGGDTVGVAFQTGIIGNGQRILTALNDIVTAIKSLTVPPSA